MSFPAADLKRIEDLQLAFSEAWEPGMSTAQTVRKQFLMLKDLAVSLGFTEDVTGDVCTGDEVLFIRGVFKSYKPGGKKRFPDSYKVVAGEVVHDSYGESKQQHTFTLSLGDGEKTLVKGRNLYRFGTFARPRDPEDRRAALDEKHGRGRKARNEAKIRKRKKKRYE